MSLPSPSPQQPSPAIKEIQSALWGCVEVPVFLKIGCTRFSGTPAAYLRSTLILILIILLTPILVPLQFNETPKSYLWNIGNLFLFISISTAAFLALFYLMQGKELSKEQFWQFATAYNWLGLSSLAIQLPFIIMGQLGVHTWEDAFALMLLTSLYSYSYEAFLIKNLFRLSWVMSVSFTLMDLMIGQAVNNLCDYLMS